MYSPKINEELIPILYKEAKENKLPMTKYVSMIIENHLFHLPEEYKIGRICCENIEQSSSDTLGKSQERGQEVRRDC